MTFDHSSNVRAGGILEVLGTSVLPSLRKLLSSGDIGNPHRLCALYALVDVIDAADAGELLGQLELVEPRHYPLTRLYLCRFLWIRADIKLSPTDASRLVALMHAAYEEWGRHQFRWAKAVEADRTKNGEFDVKDDWDKLEAEFMATYRAKLDKLNPPGWAEA